MLLFAIIAFHSLRGLSAQTKGNEQTPIQSGLRLSCDVQNLGGSLSYKWWISQNRAMMIGVNIDDYEIQFTVYRWYGTKASEPMKKPSGNVFGQYEFHLKTIDINGVKLSPYTAMGVSLGVGISQATYSFQPHGAIFGSFGVECFLSSSISVGIQQGLILSYQNSFSGREAVTLGQIDLGSRCSFWGQIYF